eukprot:TRINITY_DN1933_c0_g1_i1.p1 TRINITY_DN1933_c0_g1~~TRINITY_DN1933_c0_g1_i1.p1  ORF type:complete len:418 (-),score=64.85 TRINITY_DN1933_c0_g1_i1:9-1262(-)
MSEINVFDWTVEDVYEWICSIGLDIYADAFVSNHVSGRDLLKLNHHDIKNELNITVLRDRKILYKEIDIIRSVDVKDTERLTVRLMLEDVERLTEELPDLLDVLEYQKEEISQLESSVEGFATARNSYEDGKNIQKTLQYLDNLGLSEDVFCGVCFEYTVVYTLGCNHKTCGRCITELIHTALRDFSLLPIRCCGIEIDSFIIQEHSTAEEFDRIKRVLFEKYTVDKIYCPEPQCSAMISLDGVKDNLTECICDVCQTPICISCFQIDHPFRKCKQEEDNNIMGFIQINHLKHCPRCNAIIELAQGCYHITCLCGFEFCYLCLSEWRGRRCRNRCKLWDEELLRGQAREIIRYRPQDNMQEIIDRIENRECDHVWEHNFGQGGRCFNCPFHMYQYYHECSNCFVRAMPLMCKVPYIT